MRLQSLVITGRTIHRVHRLGRWQIGLLVAGLLAAGAATFLFIEMHRVENQIARTRERFERQQAVLRALQQRVAEIEAGQQEELPTPESIRSSLVRFEKEFLTPAEQAELAVIREVNELADQSGVILSEINFDPIEQKVLEGSEGGERRRGESLFPGLEMSFTVEGSYANVRAFLLSLEGSRAFLIIDSLDLKSVEQPGRRGFAQRATTDQVIALGMKLSVYYQRERRHI